MAIILGKSEHREPRFLFWGTRELSDLFQGAGGLSASHAVDGVNDLSLVSRKPVFGASDQVRLKPACQHVI